MVIQMTKKCPDCGKELPDEAHFCQDCGHDFFKKESAPIVTRAKNNSDSIFSNGKIFLILIAIVVVVGVAIILSFGTGGGNNQASDADDGVEHVGLTISGVEGYDGNNDGKKYYSLWTEVLFTSVPSNQKGYIIKTIYYDENGTDLGQESETLSNAYYDTDYSISIGHHTMYTKPDLDHVTVEIIKDGKTIDNYTNKVDKGKISFLN